jgi:Mg2+-importing ATPase
VRTHRVSAVAVLVRQLRSALLGLLAAEAIVSYFVGAHTDALVIAVVLTVIVGLGFANEYRAGRAGSAMRLDVRHQAAAVRGGIGGSVDVVDLVPATWFAWTRAWCCSPRPGCWRWSTWGVRSRS